jgi:ABC-type transport system involved in multi-copper enzyme maturation permease subunit
MSVQTGETSPSGPASQRAVDRARFRWERLLRDPNPIWIRELKQAARLGRTPVILMVITILMALLIASVGGVASTSTSPARTGGVLFQTYFSIAFFVVAWVGPAVAANSIAAEREGKTWEALVLTGLRPETIARGKFLAAFTAIGTYVVMLAPVGAVPFLFGGVTAFETVVAFVLLFVFALLGVAFGLAISSKMESLRVAIVLALLLGVPLSMATYGSLGVGLSFGIHDLWPEVPEGPPVWLPTALVRAPFGIEYVLYLVVLPIALIAIPAWFLYEVTVANLTAPNDDRSSGLKRWFIVASLVFFVAAFLPVFAVDADDLRAVAIVAASGLLIHYGFCTFVFAGEPIGPSRRIVRVWERDGTSKVARFLGPGLSPTSILELLLGVATILGVGAVCLAGVQVHRATIYDAEEHVAQIASFTFYAACFLVFLVGLRSLLRSRGRTPAITRVLLVAIGFGVAVGPWIIAAILGVLGNASDDSLVIASPSPFYAFFVLSAIERTGQEIHVYAGVTASVGWAGLGAFLTLVARRRAAAVVATHEEMLSEASARLDAEDAAIEEADRLAAEPASEAASPEEGDSAADPGDEPAPEAVRPEVAADPGDAEALVQPSAAADASPAASTPKSDAPPAADDSN